MELEEEVGTVTDLNLDFCDMSRMGQDLAGQILGLVGVGRNVRCGMESERCESIGERLYKFV